MKHIKHILYSLSFLMVAACSPGFSGNEDLGQSSSQSIADHNDQQSDDTSAVVVDDVKEDDQSSQVDNDSSGMDSSGMNSSGMDSSGMDSNGMDSNGMDSSGMDSGGMDSGGMDHGGMDHSDIPSVGRDEYCAMNHSGSDHTMHANDPSKMGEHMVAMGFVTPQNATHTLVKCGNWSDPSVWNTKTIPGNNAKVYVPMGLGVTYDINSNVSLDQVKIEGFMDFHKTKTSRLKLDTLVTGSNSVFQIGTEASPITGKAEIIIADNGAINTNIDPIYIGRGVVLHGTSEIHGLKKKAFLTVNGAASKGQSTLRMSGNLTNWNVGDEIVIIGTHYSQGIKRLGHEKSEDEIRTITAKNGDTITLNQPLEFEHDVYPGHDFKVYVGNSTRSVLVRSENPDNVRGHFMLMHSPYAKVRYAEFRDLGRSDRRIPVSDVNVIGRYSLHIHRTGSKEHAGMAVLEGNSVINGIGWGIVHHDSFAAVNHNFVFNVVGAGIVAEAGTEIGEWVGNLVSSVTGGTSNARDDKKIMGPGHRGIAYFAASRAVIQQRNIAANTRVGWDWEGRLYIATGDLAGGYSVDLRAFKFNPLPLRYHKKDHDTIQIIGFEGNRAFALDTAIHSTHRNNGTMTNTLNEFRDFKAFGLTQTGFNFRNYTWDYGFKDIVLIGDPAHTSHKTAIEAWRKTEGMSFVNVHVENFGVAYDYSYQNFTGVISGFKAVNTPIKVQSETEVLERDYQLFLAGKLSTDPRIIHPETKKPYIPQAYPVQTIDPSKVTELAKPKLTITGGMPTQIHEGQKFDITGTIQDSFGTYPLGQSFWYTSPQKYTDTQEKARAYEVVFATSGDPTTAPLKDILPHHGVINKNGKWIMPITFWIGDRYTAINHPFTFYLEVVGMDEAFLKQHELTNYQEPTRDLNLYDYTSNY